jgi:ankyrin repeat protein
MDFHSYCKSSSIDLERIKYFLSNENVNKFDDEQLTPLFYIFENNSKDFQNKFEIIKYLLESKANVNVKNEYSNSILHLICNDLNQTIFPAIIEEKKKDINVENDSNSNFLLFDLLDQLDQLDQTDLVEKKEEMKTDPIINPNLKRNLELIELLLKFNANPNLKNKNDSKFNINFFFFFYFF